MSLSTADLVGRIAAETDIPRVSVDEVVRTLFSTVAQEVINNQNTVTFTNFGKFSPKLTGGNNRRNPRTGEKVSVDSYHSLAFNISPNLRNAARSASQ